MNDTSQVERHDDGRPREWDWVLVCGEGRAAGTWLECRGALARASEKTGAELLCEAHRTAGEHAWDPDATDPSEAWEKEP